ncbi:MAG: hypothetical protein MJZ20_05660 [Bacteroidaceae bacterium]|nr:hypothetical protein [Bacteroidaceae bacterium]
MGKKIKDENHVTIQGWMINKLGLKGSELIAYAVIWGFTQNLDNQLFTGSRQYLADWCNISVKGIDKVIMSLTQKGYIIRHEKFINNVMFVEYSCADPEEALKNSGEANKVLGGGEQSSSDPANKVRPGGEQSSPNNIEHIYIDNIEHIKKEKEEKAEVENDLSKIKARGTNFDRIIDAYTENEKLREALQDFIKMRKAIKKVLTDRALKMICSQLDKLAQDDAAKVAILEQSILNSWQAVYPLKEDANNGNRNAANNQQFMVQPNTGTGSGPDGRSDYRITEGLL